MPNFKKLPISRVKRKVKSLLSSNRNAFTRVGANKRARQQLVSKNREIAALRKELARVRGDGRASSLSPADTVVFFLVGHQKSGTTWLMKMLDAHPEVLCQGEGRPFGRNFQQRDRVMEGRRGYPPASLYNAITTSRNLRLWVKKSVWTKHDRVEEHLNNLTGLAIEYFLTQKLLGSGKRIVGDKTVLLNSKIVQEIATLCPDAKAIHIIRDGRDVAVSTMHHIWNQAEDQGGSIKITPEQQAKREAYRRDPQQLIEAGGGIFPDGWLEDYAKKWRTNMIRSMKDGPVLLGDNYTEVKYEDLLERPEEEMRRLLSFLGADAGEGVVSQCVSAASFEKLSEGRKRGQEASSFYRKGIAGDWKNAFTEQNKREFKAAAGDALVKLGYEPDDSW